MNLGRVLELLVAAIAVAVALSVAPTNPLAAACLFQFSILTVLEHDSERFRSIVDGYGRELSAVKLALLLVALVLLR
ncbi:hypothetical protein [Natrononativus amylolyticus]|uniref:hypothetical protein n=1 Tax=Natrononativus amylolyticus TaxID=2963434 RepID=UPI0020CD53B4|nr:hypothetical protein [Natrononativus amylolyticus]